MSPRPLKSKQILVSPSELRESCCAMREATEKMARIHGITPPVCQRKEKCLQQAAQNAA